MRTQRRNSKIMKELVDKMFQMPVNTCKYGFDSLHLMILLIITYNLTLLTADFIE